MAKYQVGLPEDFSIKISKEELTGPASLPDYLDSDPLLESLKRAAKPKNLEAKTPPPPPQPPVPPGPKVLQVPLQKPPVTVAPVVPEAALALRAQVKVTNEAKNITTQVFQGADQAFNAELREAKPSVARVTNKPAPRRLQINLSVEAERKVGELLELLNSQSPERVTISDLAQALFLSLHDARADINVSRLPIRGKWGTPTARSFPSALAQALREAIVEFDSKQGGNPFRKVVGE